MRANRYVSYLATEIEPKALTTLSQFERATERAFERIAAFNDRGASRLGNSITGGFDSRARSAITSTSTALAGVQQNASRAKESLTAAAASANGMSTAFFRSAQALNVVQGPLGPLSGRLSSLGYILRDLSGLSLAGVLGGGGAFAIGTIASSYQKVTDRLRPFYETQQQTNAAMRDVIGIARETRQALDPVAQLYARLAQAGKDAGVKQDTTALTTTIAKAARLSGGDDETQKNGITQFLQGYGSGTLGGEELKSIRENTFRLAKALADGLGVPIAQLKKLGAEGKLTPQVIAQALSAVAGQIDVEFARLPKRIGQALTEAQNNLAIFLGRIDEATGATQGFSKAISLVGGNIGNTATAVAGLGAVFAARSLTPGILAATNALKGFALAQSAVSQAGRGRDVSSGVLARVGASAPIVQARQGVEQARSRMDSALGDQRAADAGVRGARAQVFAANQRLAAAREAAALAVAEQRTAEQSARSMVVFQQARLTAAQQELTFANQTAAVRRASDIESARARLAIARQDLVSARAAQAGAQVRSVGASQAVDQAASGPGSRSDRARAAATAIRQQVVAEAELAAAQNATAAAAARVASVETELTAARAAQRVPTAQQIAATTFLAAQQERLAAATQLVTNATVVNTGAANANAARGIGTLALAEQKIAAELALAGATTRSTVTTAAATAATLAHTAAQRAFTAAASLSARAMGLLQKAGAGLSALLGGPLGIALIAVTAGFVFLATRTDEATSAAERFKSKQDELISKLGSTEEAFARAGQAAARYRLELAKSGVAEAEQRQRSALGSLGASLTDAASSVDLKTAQGRADFAALREMAGAATSGNNASGVLNIKRLQEIQARQPGGKFASNALARLFGSDPAAVGIKAVGVKQTSNELGEARAALAAAEAASRAPPPKRVKVGAGGGAPRRTDAELDADAALFSSGGTKAVQARREYNATAAKLKAEREALQKAGKFDAAAEERYVQQLGQAQQKLDAVGDAQRGAAAGATANRKAIAAQNAVIREQTKELKEAEQNASKLAAIQSRYQDDPTPVKRGEADKEALDNLFVRIRDGKAEIQDTIQLLNNETGKLEPFTRADAEKVKRNIDDGVRKPFNDLIRDQGRELEIARLILDGREAEADVLRTKFDLVDRIGKLEEGDEARIRANLARQRQVNAAIAQRERLIDIEAKAYGNVQSAIRDILATPIDKDLPDNLKGVFDRLIQNFRDSVADKISVALFGDAEQTARDKMTGALDSSADNLTTSADNLTTSADALVSSAATLDRAADRLGDSLGGSTFGSSSFGDGIVADAAERLGQGGLFTAPRFDAAGNMTEPSYEEEGDIVAVGKKLTKSKPKKQAKPETIEDRYNRVGGEFAAKVFGPGSILTKGFAKLGTFLSGAQYGGVGTMATSVLGVKGSSLGAAIGGGLGKSILGGAGGLLSKGLSAIAPQLGQFAGPLGAIAGSVIGSVVGGLLKKPEKGAAQVTGSGINASGTSSALKSQANGLGQSVQSGVGKIAEALGGAVGDYAVTIGTYNGKYRVQTNGGTHLGGKNRGQPDAKDFGENGQEEAIRYAIVDAIRDGAVKGIREGAQRLLRAGQDLDKQLDKALKFQGVFRELKQLTDPVGAALDDLNLQFNGLIDIFNEAGASAAEFADLQKLYDLKRADALKSATNGSIDAYQDFINGLKSGPDSPLGRRTVYENAKTRVDAFRGDLAAGKIVDQDKLLDALGDLQDASGTINGSREAFFNDFFDILALAEKAKGNITASQAGGGALPGSPFADPLVQGKLTETAQNTHAIYERLGDVVTAINKSSGGAGSYGDGSSLDNLPSVRVFGQEVFR